MQAYPFCLLGEVTIFSQENVDILWLGDVEKGGAMDGHGQNELLSRFL